MKECREEVSSFVNLTFCTGNPEGLICITVDQRPTAELKRKKTIFVSRRQSYFDYLKKE